MASKNKANDGVEFVSSEMSEIEILRAQLAAAQAQIQELSTKPKRTRVAKVMSEEEAAKRVAFETVDYAAEGTSLGDFQRMGHNVHLLALSKVAKYIPFGILADTVHGLAQAAATHSGKALAEVITDITTQKPRAKREKAVEGDEPAVETPSETEEAAA